MDDASLEASRWRGDPLADEVVEWLAAHRPAKGTRDLLVACRKWRAESPACDNFLRAFARTPAWLEAEEESLRLGQELWWRNGIVALLVGFTQLIDSYAGGRDNAVLVLSGQLSQTHAFRRLVETAVFTFDCATPGALQPGGHGRIAIARVRLLHAEVRRRCLKRQYPTEKFQTPVNQEAMAGTLMLFSAGVIKALTRVGVHIIAEERESYHRLWRLAGHLLGVERALLPESYAEELQLYDAIKAHSLHPNDDTRKLFESAVLGLQTGAKTLPWPVWLAGGGLLASRTFLEQLTVALCDENITNLCGLRASRPAQAAIGVAIRCLRMFGRLACAFPRLFALQLHVSTLIVKRLLSTEVLLKGRPAQFSDPGFHEEARQKFRVAVCTVRATQRLARGRASREAAPSALGPGSRPIGQWVPGAKLLLLVVAGLAGTRYARHALRHGRARGHLLAALAASGLAAALWRGLGAPLRFGAGREEEAEASEDELPMGPAMSVRLSSRSPQCLLAMSSAKSFKMGEAESDDEALLEAWQGERVSTGCPWLERQHEPLHDA